MKDLLIKKLHEYLQDNNPDMLFDLQQEGKVISYLEEKVDRLGDTIRQLETEKKPAYIVEEICMKELTDGYAPSRYNYLLDLMDVDFPDEIERWKNLGVHVYAVVDLVKLCRPVFDSMNFSADNEDDRMIRYTVIGVIKEHLVGKLVDKEYLDKINFRP